MNYNLRVEMERVNGKIVTSLEIAGVGRSGRVQFTSPTFDEAMATLKEKHDAQLGLVEAYHKPAVPAESAPVAAAPVPKKAAKKKAKAKKPATRKEAQRALNASTKAAMESVAAKGASRKK